LLHVRPDLVMLDIRGNVETRVAKLDAGEFDAIVLAEAGLKRLGLEQRITRLLPRDLILPAVGQGALGLETREDDEGARAALALLDDAPTHAAVLAERALLAALRAGCLAPVGAWGRVEEAGLTLDATVHSPDGRQRIAASGSAPPEQAEQLGRDVAAQLLASGAGEMIASAKR
jgi:hydroxymethylbilane synthase